MKHLISVPTEPGTAQPAAAYRRAWDALAAARPERDAARTMVWLLALAHDRGVEADIAAALDAMPDDGCLPDLAEMRHRFTPATTSAPAVWIEKPSASAHNRPLGARGGEDFAEILQRIHVCGRDRSGVPRPDSLFDSVVDHDPSPKFRMRFEESLSVIVEVAFLERAETGTA